MAYLGGGGAAASGSGGGSIGAGSSGATNDNQPTAFQLEHMIGITRPFFADPEYIKKISEGRSNE